MPTTYAHYKFGQDVINVLNEKDKSVISKYIDIFNYGIYGPDILYCYNPLDSNGISKIAGKCHHEPFKNILDYSKNIIRTKNNIEPYMAYMYGFICHFSLDVYCHGYINQMRDEYDMRHSLVEAEFDRMLMLKDGYNPLKYKPTAHMKPDKSNASIIGEVFPGIDGKIAYKAMKSMKFFCNVIASSNVVVRGIVFGILKITGHYNAKNGIVIRKKPANYSDVVTKELYRMYGKAIVLARFLITEFDGNVMYDVPYCKIVQRTFTGSYSMEDEIDKEFEEERNKMLTVGLINKKEILVEKQMTAKYVGSGELEVLATPNMIALMENVAYNSVKAFLDDGMGTVGTLMNVKHLSATPVGMKVMCESKLIEIDGRRLVFEVKAEDETGIIGQGFHERFIVDNEKFEKKAYSKIKQ